MVAAPLQNNAWPPDAGFSQVWFQQRWGFIHWDLWNAFHLASQQRPVFLTRPYQALLPVTAEFSVLQGHTNERGGNSRGNALTWLMKIQVQGTIHLPLTSDLRLFSSALYSSFKYIHIASELKVKPHLQLFDCRWNNDPKMTILFYHIDVSWAMHVCETYIFHIAFLSLSKLLLTFKTGIQMQHTCISHEPWDKFCQADTAWGRL